MISTLRDEIAVDAIQRDLHFMGRFVNSLGTPAGQKVGGLLSLGVLGYLSLFVYEADRQMRRIDPHAAARLSPSTRAILERSRHSLKLFDDKSRGGMGGVIGYFANEIRASQRNAFGGSRFLPFSRLWAKDLGLLFTTVA